MKKKWKWIAIPILLFLLIFALLQIDRESMLHSFRQVPLRLVLLLGVLQIITQLLINLQWHQISRLTESPISYCDMIYINCQGAVIDSITPGVKFGGEVTRTVQLSRIGNMPGEASAATVALQKLFSLSSLFLILMFAVGYLIGRAEFLQTRALQVLVYTLLTVFLLLFLAIFFMPERMTRLIKGWRPPRRKWAKSLLGFLLTTLEKVGIIRKNKKAMIALSLLSIFIWLFYPFKLYLLAMQFADAVNPVYIGAVTYAAYMVALLPIFPGGLGGFEGTLSGLLVAGGYALSDAAAMTIVFRFSTFWFVMLISVIFISFYKFLHLLRGGNLRGRGNGEG